MNNMDYVDKKKPALIGGLIVGLLSSIPIIQMANAACCLWALVGGIVAARILIDRSPHPLTSRDGAKIGLMAGLVGAVIYFIIESPITIYQMEKVLISAGALPIATDEAREVYERISQNTVLKVILAFVFVFIGSLILLGFTVLGGILGVALFEKRKDQPPPPQYPPQSPPPQYPQQ